MPSTFLDFLYGPHLTEIAQSPKVKRGTPRPDALAPLFNASPTNKPPGDKVEYIQFSGNRTGARLVSRMSPAKARDIPGAEIKRATAVCTKELLPIDGDMIDALKSQTPDVQARARRELIRRIGEFMTSNEISRTNAVLSMLATGKIFTDADGNILPNSTGAKFTIDFSVPAANAITKDGANGTVNIGDWSNAATKIQFFLRDLRKANIKVNNYALKTILYGENVPDYLLANTTLQQYFARHVTFRDGMVENNEIPNGTLGWNWVPVHTTYLADAAGNAVEWFGGNYIGVMPDVSDDWYEFVEGGSMVPNQVAAIGSNWESMLDAVRTVNGPYSYCEMTTNPLSINQIIGDSFLPILKVPGTYYFGACA